MLPVSLVAGSAWIGSEGITTMKALVLSGGMGTRLRPFTHSMPKQLMPIANRPVVEHVLDDVRRAGAVDVGVVVGDHAEEIERAVGDGSRLGLRLTYLRQDAPLGLAHCVLLARDFLGDDDFLMYLGDNILSDGVAGMARTFAADRPDVQLAVHRVPDPREFGVAVVGDDGTVLRLEEKPQDPPGDLAVMGAYFFTSAIHEAVAAIRPSPRGELEITDAIQWLVSAGRPVRAVEHTGFWQDAGDIPGVLRCNRWALDGTRREIRGWVDESSVLNGPVVVEPGARIVRSRIDGPVIVGARTVIEDGHVGPHTSVGRDCVIRRSGIGDSIVLDDAELVGVPGLHSSIIGRSASVRPTDTSALGPSLVIGDHGRAEVRI
ncbi:glucose-1-phosphate thymidylyltransferase [Nocardiopsis sp. N85]|uniref:glucose-1-phosphate thymidylyltransferase n=1 Tax=Nocardiopsis sp. N85 TaxID=3029400 RepID=UPI0031586ABE